MSKRYLKVYRYVIAFIAGLTLSACAVASHGPSSSPVASPAPTAQTSDQTFHRSDDSPGALASLRLTEQARILLEGGRIYDAIATLERAINVDPLNGQNYYYLAEAWLKKGNFQQAKEFNRIAAIYLRDEPEWTRRVNDQRERIILTYQ